MHLLKWKQYKIRGAINAFLRDRTGATMIEYALILSLVAGAVLIAFQSAGNATSDLLGSVQAAMADGDPGDPGGPGHENDYD